MVEMASMFSRQERDHEQAVARENTWQAPNEALFDQPPSIILFRKMLDHLASAVFLIGEDRKIEFANSAAQRLLREKKILSSHSGKLAAKSSMQKFEKALDDATDGEPARVASGESVPLFGATGARAAAYILPLATGYCAVFITQCGEQFPVQAEVLRTLFDLTPMEAKISTLIAEGDRPIDISESLGLSINTVRTHLSNVFSKTCTAHQPALVGLVRGLAPPVSV